MRVVRKNGAVLIMTLMALVLVFMMVHVLMQTVGLGLSSSGSFYDREAALQAAESGQTYAVTRLQYNPKWRGDANRTYWKGRRDFPQGNSSFLVSESYGNVVGVMFTKAKACSAFRIKFSFEDDSEDTLTKAYNARFADYGTTGEPKTALPIAMPYVSLNYLTSGVSQVPVYRANDDGKGIAEETKNLEYGANGDGSERSFANHLPPMRALIIVEGLAGAGLRDCKTPEDVNKIVNSASNATPLTRRYVEAYYSANPPILNGDVAFAKSPINFTAKDKIFVRSFEKPVVATEDKSTVPSAGAMGSNDSINLNNSTLNTYNGKLRCPQKENTTFKDDPEEYVFKDSEGNDVKMQFKTAVEACNSSVTPIEFEDVVSVKNTAQNKLMPGYYEWHLANDSTSEQPYYELRRYEVDSSGTPSNSSAYKIVRAGDVTPSAAGNGEGAGNGESGESSHEQGSVQYVNMGPDGKVSFVMDVDGHITAPVLKLQGELYCDGSLTIGTAKNEVTKSCPAVWLGGYCPDEQDEKDAEEAGVLQATGNVTVLGAIKGTGSMVTKDGDVSFCGESVMDCGDSGVAVYANNVNIAPLTVALDKAPNGQPLTDAMTDNIRSFVPDGDKINEILAKYGADSGIIVGDLDAYEGAYVASGEVVRDSPQYTHAERYFDFTERELQTKGCTELNELFAKEYNVRVSFIGLLASNMIFYFLDSDGKHRTETVDGIPNQMQQYKITRRHGVSELKRRKPLSLNSSIDVTVTEVIIPAYAVINDDVLGEALKKYADLCGDLCYGDQNFGGMVYAVNNINVKLGDEFRFLVTGVLRAQNGAINITCKDSVLTYDETALRSLMPEAYHLNRVFWTCW